MRVSFVAGGLIAQEVVQQDQFDPGQRETRSNVRLETIKHSHPENSPTQYTEHRDQVGQTLGSPEPGALCSAARFEDLMEDFDLPTPGVPFNLLDGIATGPDREIGDQLPLDLLATFRSAAFGGMNDCQVQGRVALLFSDRRQDTYFPVSCLEDGSVQIAIAVSELDAMQTFDHNLSHFVRDRVTPVSCQAIDAGSDQELSSDLLGRAEQLVDIALAVPDMDASSWIIQ